MDLTIIEKINKNCKLYPEMQIVKDILSENGVDFENKTVDMNKLIQYHKSTDNHGIIMQTKEAILTKVCLCLLLFPQKENDKINYLLGKGIGVEIALLGECKDRVIDGPVFEPRSHSDFEIYNTEENFSYPAEFLQLFGAQEIYPKTQTKGLSNLPNDFMDKTYETVNFFGIEVLVPCLELMFVDKVLRQESTPRKEGCDAQLLATRYNLDLELVDKIYLNYSEKPLQEQLDKSKLTFEYLCERLLYMLENCEIETINNMINIAQNKKLNTYSYGIPYKAIAKIEPNDIVDGKLTETYLSKLKIQYNKYLNFHYAPLAENKETLEEIISNSLALKNAATV